MCFASLQLSRAMRGSDKIHRRVGSSYGKHGKGHGYHRANRGVDTFMHGGIDESSVFMLDDDGRERDIAERIIHRDFFNGA